VTLLDVFHATHDFPCHSELFFKGPVPWSWLESAGALPGKALHVAIRLWYEAGLAGSSEVEFSMTSMARMGASRWAASRGLTALEGAGLVSAVRRAGRRPVVTILPTSVLTNTAVLEAGEELEREDAPSQDKKGGDEESPLPPGEVARRGE
jgi:DNA-binding transcriptional ArsR family regulator